MSRASCNVCQRRVLSANCAWLHLLAAITISLRGWRDSTRKVLTATVYTFFFFIVGALRPKYATNVLLWKFRLPRSVASGAERITICYLLFSLFFLLFLFLRCRDGMGTRLLLHASVTRCSHPQTSVAGTGSDPIGWSFCCCCCWRRRSRHSEPSECCPFSGMWTKRCRVTVPSLTIPLLLRHADVHAAGSVLTGSCCLRISDGVEVCSAS